MQLLQKLYTVHLRHIDIQDKIAKLINKAGIGLSAEITEAGQGNSALVLSSTRTGLKSGETSQFDIFESSSGLKTGTGSSLSFCSKVNAPIA